MKPHPIAHRIYLRIKAELTDGLPEEAHALIINAANLTEERIDAALKQLIKAGMTHTEAEQHIINLFAAIKTVNGLVTTSDLKDMFAAALQEPVKLKGQIRLTKG